MASKKEKKRKESLNKSLNAEKENKDVVWFEKEDEDLLNFYNDKQLN
jgi:hypothetical protein